MSCGFFEEIDVFEDPTNPFDDAARFDFGVDRMLSQKFDKVSDAELVRVSLRSATFHFSQEIFNELCERSQFFCFSLDF